jgi:hypothetical protein
MASRVTRSSFSQLGSHGETDRQGNDGGSSLKVGVHGGVATTALAVMFLEALISSGGRQWWRPSPAAPGSRVGVKRIKKRIENLGRWSSPKGGNGSGEDVDAGVGSGAPVARVDKWHQCSGGIASCFRVKGMEEGVELTCGERNWSEAAPAA